MTHSPVTEAYCFLALFASGAAAAAVYAVCRFLRGIFLSKLATVALDLAFSAAALFFLVFSLEKACGGNVRIYQIVGFIIGFCLVNHTVLLIKQIFATTQSVS